jgi:hypothetical protein
MLREEAKCSGKTNSGVRCLLQAVQSILIELLKTVTLDRLIDKVMTRVRMVERMWITVFYNHLWTKGRTQ